MSPTICLDDPFSVPTPQPLWKTLPIFLLTLPWTILFLSLGLLVGFTIIPFFPAMSQQWIDRCGRLCNQLLLLSLRITFTIQVDDPKSLDAKLFVAPHICVFEGIVFLSVMGHCRPMSASFTKTIPIFGYFIKSLNPLYVERGKKSGGLTTALKQSLNEGRFRHLIFPEGTYSNGSRILKFKSGAFVPGHPVAPVAFTFSQYAPFWNRQESSLIVQIYRVLSRPYTPVHIQFLPIVSPSKEELNDPKLYAENVRVLLSTSIGRPLSRYELKDSPNFQLDIHQKQAKQPN